MAEHLENETGNFVFSGFTEKPWPGNVRRQNRRESQTFCRPSPALSPVEDNWATMSPGCGHVVSTSCPQLVCLGLQLTRTRSGDATYAPATLQKLRHQSAIAQAATKSTKLHAENIRVKSQLARDFDGCESFQTQLNYVFLNVTELL